MRHKFPVLTVKKWLKSVYIYGSYRKNKIGVPFFWTTLYMPHVYIFTFSLKFNVFLFTSDLEKPNNFNNLYHSSHRLSFSALPIKYPKDKSGI